MASRLPKFCFLSSSRCSWHRSLPAWFLETAQFSKKSRCRQGAVGRFLRCLQPHGSPVVDGLHWQAQSPLRLAEDDSDPRQGFPRGYVVVTLSPIGGEPPPRAAV